MELRKTKEISEDEVIRRLDEMNDRLKRIEQQVGIEPMPFSPDNLDIVRDSDETDKPPTQEESQNGNLQSR